MPQDDQDITLHTVLQHMQGMEQRLTAQIDAVRMDLKNDIHLLDVRLQTVEQKVNVISAQIENMDHRLDDLEVVKVPKLKKAVGMR